jgi:hypothetical protein
MRTICPTHVTLFDFYRLIFGEQFRLWSSSSCSCFRFPLFRVSEVQIFSSQHCYQAPPSIWDFRFSRRRVWRWLSSRFLRRVVWKTAICTSVCYLLLILQCTKLNKLKKLPLSASNRMPGRMFSRKWTPGLWPYCGDVSYVDCCRGHPSIMNEHG